MKDPKRILFISQEICPYLVDETPIRMLNRRLPELFQSNDYETRTFMPKFGEINERRNQLHEVIRLSGINIIIEDTDHPLLIKVTSIPAARIQIYFIDNEDYFQRRRGVVDVNSKEYADNDERCIFFARSVLETVNKLRWSPNVVYCSGWMSALAPLYIKKNFGDSPFFAKTKVILSLDNEEYKQPFPTNFSQKLLTDNISPNEVRSIAGFPVGYEELMRLAIDYSDAIVVSSNGVSQRVLNYAETSGKPILPYDNNEEINKYLDFCNSLLPDNRD